MGLAPTPIIVSPNGAGNASYGSAVRSAVDDAVAGLQSKLLIYLRAMKINVASTRLVDSLGNPLTQASGNTKNNSDANFAGHESITLNNQNAVYAMNAGGIGIGASPIAMTNSFSVIAGLRNPASFAGTSWCLYGDGLTSNGGVGVLASTSGQLEVFIGNSGAEVNAAGFFSVSTTNIFWYSYDAVAKIHRYGLNTPAIIGQVQGAATRTSQGTAAVCQPFGYFGGGTAGYWGFHRWMLFNKAFMNGAVAADDQQFSALLWTYKAYLGL